MNGTSEGSARRDLCFARIRGVGQARRLLADSHLGLDSQTIVSDVLTIYSSVVKTTLVKTLGVEGPGRGRGW